MNTKTAIYSGTFDPITNGHIDIIKRALKIFDKVIIAVASSKAKNTMFDLDARVAFAKKSTEHLNVEVKPFDTLLVNFANKEKVSILIRGIRTPSDFEFEQQMDYANQSLDQNIDTIYLMPQAKNNFISSSLVRELIRFDKSVHHLVPKNILSDVE